jgi:hypothetical protein
MLHSKVKHCFAREIVHAEELPQSSKRFVLHANFGNEVRLQRQFSTHGVWNRIECLDWVGLSQSSLFPWLGGVFLRTITCFCSLTFAARRVRRRWIRTCHLGCGCCWSRPKTCFWPCHGYKRGSWAKARVPSGCSGPWKCTSLQHHYI